MMVDKALVNHTRRIRKRGAILNKFKSHNLYWPGTTSEGRRIVRVPYSLNTGFFSRLFGKRKQDPVVLRAGSFIRWINVLNKPLDSDLSTAGIALSTLQTTGPSASQIICDISSFNPDYAITRELTSKQWQVQRRNG